jgi:acetyl-CoA hydrolase
VSTLKLGAGVTTSRSDIHMVATEFGVADLWGLTIQERVQALVNVAHPDFREELLHFAHDNHYISKN